MDDMRGAACAECGAEFSEEDMKDQARLIAEKLIREKMKGLKFS